MEQTDQQRTLSASCPPARTATVLYITVRYVAFMLGAFVSVAAVVLFFYLISIWPYEFTSPRLQGFFDRLLGLSLLVVAPSAPFYTVACGWKTSKWIDSRLATYHGEWAAKVGAGVFRNSDLSQRAFTSVARSSCSSTLMPG
jgi:hypothetical protein